MSRRTAKDPELQPLPKVVYVGWDDDGDGGLFLTSGESVENFDHGSVVGVYELKTTAKVLVTKQLVSR